MSREPYDPIESIASSLRNIDDTLEIIAEAVSAIPLRFALIEVVESLTPRYDPDHPEDHGFSARTADAIRSVMKP